MGKGFLLMAYRSVIPMIPLADYPSIVFRIIHLYAIGSVVIETPRAIPGRDGSRFPSGIYRIGREGIQREGILINVKLEVRSIEEGSGSGIGSEDRICLAGTSVISLDWQESVSLESAKDGIITHLSTLRRFYTRP